MTVRGLAVQVGHRGIGCTGGLDLEKVKSKLRKFSKDRDWEQFHNPKNLATALSVEVAELLEIFQWSNDGGLSEIKDPITKITKVA